jgi:biopolymer transport protein ExbD
LAADFEGVMLPLEPSFTLPRRTRKIPRAEITALIDVVLLLLIFVILTSQYVVTPGFEVVLPAITVPGPPGPRAVVLEIPRFLDAPYFLNGEPVPPEDLVGRLAAVQREHPQEVLVIAPDRRAGAERLLEALEKAQGAGLHRIRIATRESVSGSSSR